MTRKIVAILLLAMAGCKATDSDIRADIASKARQDLNFAGLQYTVENGAVHFTGRCPSTDALAKIKQSIKSIHVIRASSYRVKIAPVLLDKTTPIKLKADSVLSKYPLLTAQVSPNGVTLRGGVSAIEKEELMKAFKKKQIGPVIDSLSFR